MTQVYGTYEVNTWGGCLGAANTLQEAAELARVNSRGQREVTISLQATGRFVAKTDKAGKLQMPIFAPKEEWEEIVKAQADTPTHVPAPTRAENIGPQMVRPTQQEAYAAFQEKSGVIPFEQYLQHIKRLAEEFVGKYADAEGHYSRVALSLYRYGKINGKAIDLSTVRLIMYELYDQLGE